jgi:hypothetical protein
MLSLTETPDGGWSKIYANLLRLTRQNEVILAKFLRAKHKVTRLQIVHDAEAKGHATSPLLNVLKVNVKRF